MRAICAEEVSTGSSRMQPARELLVEVDGGADHCEVGEGLGEVAEELAALADFLRVEPEMVRVGEHLLEDELRVLELPGSSEAFDIPEGAHGERALAAVESIGRERRVIAVDQAV